MEPRHLVTTLFLLLVLPAASCVSYQVSRSEGDTPVDSAAYRSLMIGLTQYDQAVEAMGPPDRLVFRWEPGVGRFTRIEYVYRKGKHSDLADFKHGEVLVCDAVDPNITFVVPLAAAVVERRGGMLIHGAIIAREYGLPCITGIPDATNLVQTGEEITVDGYLGIVTLADTRH